MKVRVDSSRCTGHARCYGEAPEVFALDDNGFTVLRGRETVLDDDQVDRARRAAAACPEQAVEILD